MFATALLAALTSVTGAGPSTVPFTLFDNRIVVQATVDGRGPFSLIVDTGAPALMLTTSAARRLGLPLRAAGSITGAGSGKSALSLTTTPSFVLGSLHFTNVRTEVNDLSPIARAFGFAHLDGIVGYAILRKYRVGVDMDDFTLTLSEAPLPVPKSAAAVAFHDDGGLIDIPAAVDGVRGRFLIDTGDRTALTLFKPFAQANDFYRNAPVRDVVTGMGVGGPIYSDVLRTTLSVFGATVPSVVTRASRDRGGAFASGALAASIGNGLLKRFNIVYDYPGDEIFAWPSRFFGDPDRYQPLVLENGVFRKPAVTDPTVVSSPLPTPTVRGHRRTAALHRGTSAAA
jgi:hypothetical protein